MLVALGAAGDEDFGRNLLRNGAAEEGAGGNGTAVVPAPGWTTTAGAFTVVQWGARASLPGAANPGPPNRGMNFFAGGPGAVRSTARQSVDLAGAAAQIDAGGVTASLSGWLGGYIAEGDNAIVRAVFVDNNAVTLGSIAIGPVTAADRANVMALLYRDGSVPVPVGTRTIGVTVEFTRVFGYYNDGYADNLALVLHNGPSLDLLASLDSTALRRNVELRDTSGAGRFTVDAQVTLLRHTGLEGPSADAAVPVILAWRLQDVTTGRDIELAANRQEAKVNVPSHDDASPPGPAIVTWPSVLPVEPRAMPTDTDPVVDPTHLHQVQVTLSHREADGAEVIDGTLATPPAKLLLLSGKLFFSDLMTRYTQIANDPTVAVTGAQPQLQSQLAVAGQSGSIPGNSIYSYGDGTPLDVWLYPNGDTLYRGAGSVDLSGSVNHDTTVGNVRFRFAKIRLSQNGAQAFDAGVELPAGFGFGLSSANRVLEHFLPLGLVDLDPNLHPKRGQFTMSAADLGLPALWFWHEQLPLWLRAASITWQVGESAFDIVGGGQWSFVREPEQAALDQLAATLPNLQPGASRRPANDHYFRAAQDSGGQTVRVQVDADGRGRLSADVQFARVEFQAHSPYGLSVAGDGGGLLRLTDGIVDRGASKLEQAREMVMLYARDCDTAECPAANNGPAAVRFTPTDNTLGFTPDGGLIASGLIQPAPLEWGNPQKDVFTHRTTDFNEASFHMPGHVLRGADTGLPDDHRPAALMLSGFGQPGDAARVERPETPAYAEGFADYAGLNFRVTTDGSQSGESILATKTTGVYPLHHRAKYYVRLGGVSGIHQSQGFDGQLELWGFPIHFTAFGLSFLDNDNQESRTRGQLHVRSPSNFDLPFARMRFGCRGELRDAELPPDVGTRTLDYWLTTFTPQVIEFRTPKNQPVCDPPNSGFLVIGAEVPLPLVPKPVHGLLAFDGPSGDLATTADGSEVDSRLLLPAVLKVNGPANTIYELTTATKGYFNSYRAAGRPPDGFVCFNGRLNLPFFEDMKVQVHAQPKSGDAGVLLMGGWNAADGQPDAPDRAWVEAGGKTPFNAQGFDGANRGFPGYVASNADYENSDTPAFNPRAQKVWLGLFDFDFDLKWSPGTRSFASIGDEAKPPQRVALFKLQSRAKTVTARNAELNFGAQLDLPQLNVNQLVSDWVDQQTGLLRDVTNAVNEALGRVADSTGLVRAADSFDSMISAQADKLLGPVLDAAFNPVADILLDALDPLYSRVVAQAIRDGKDVSQQLRAAQTAVCDFFSKPNQFDQAFNDTRDVGRMMQEVARRVDALLADCEDGLTSLVDIVRPYENGQRKVIGKITERIAKPERLGKLGSAFVQHVADGFGDALLNTYLPQLESPFSEIEKTAREALGDIQSARHDVVAPGSQLIGELDQLTDPAAYEQIRAAITKIVCQDLGQPSVLPEEVFAAGNRDRLRAQVRRRIQEQFLGSVVPARFQFLLKSRFSEARGLFRQQLDAVFGQINGMVRQAMVDKIGDTFDTLPKASLDSLEKIVKGTRLSGYARINEHSIEELRVDGHFVFSLHDEKGMAFDAWYLLHTWQSDSPAYGCRPAGAAKAEVEIGATSGGGDGYASGTKVGLEGRASFNGNGEILGVSGGISFGGNKQMGGYKIADPHLGFAFGMEGNYLGGTASGNIKGIQADVRVFVGSACRLDQLGIADADLSNILAKHGIGPADRLTGFYYTADGTYPLERLLGIPDIGCLLSVKAKGGTGFYGLVTGTSPFTMEVGVRHRVGLQGELLCVVSGGGEITLIEGVSASDFPPKIAVYLHGSGYVEAGTFLGPVRKDFNFHAELRPNLDDIVAFRIPPFN